MEIEEDSKKRRKGSRSSASKRKKIAAEIPKELPKEEEKTKTKFSIAKDQKCDFSSLRRPPVIKEYGPGKDLYFQCLEYDYYTAPAHQPLLGENFIVGNVPIIRIFGVTEDQNSVQCNIHGKLPYLKVRAPKGFAGDNIPDLVRSLETAIQKTCNGERMTKEQKTAIFDAHMIRGNDIMNYRFGKKEDFIEVTCTIPSYIPKCRKALEDGLMIGEAGPFQFNTYESDIPFILRYMIDRDIVGCGWVKISDYQLAPKGTSLCQIEVNVLGDNVTALSTKGEWSKVSPQRILSFDIECAGRKGIFPHPDHDPVIQIGNYVQVQGEDKPIVKNVFTLKECNPIPGATVYSFEDEKTMLSQWAEFVRQTDPDIVIGYNTTKFDFPYLLNRAKAIGCKDFVYLGRVPGEATYLKNAMFSSKAYGTTEGKEAVIKGRVQMDLLVVIQREHKLRSYTLNSVSNHFLKEQKDDLHHSMITTLFEGSDDDRKRLANYCIKDAYLPLRLFQKLAIIYNYTEMARVSGVPIYFLLSRGQQIKVLSLVYRKAKLEDFFIPYYMFDKNNMNGKTYEGATVLEAQKGFWDFIIATLDFSSLYPSIMQSDNLCYTTLIRPEDVSNIPPEDINTTPSGDQFVKESVRRGLLPKILDEVLAARLEAKEALKKEKDPFKRAVLDGRQLALKVTANSVYGFTGAMIGKLPCTQIARSVTARGRMMIEYTKEFVEKEYPDHELKVIYGDTDSVMIKMKGSDIAAAMKLAIKMTGDITQALKRMGLAQVLLAFEKIYYPFLLVSKKRYAGMLYTKPEAPDFMDIKGFESKRRDNCLLNAETQKKILEKILKDRDVKGAIDYTKQTVSDLYAGKIDISKLIISQNLGRKPEEYASKQAHVALTLKMRKRDPATAPTLNSRVPYVIIKGQKKATKSERAEDPIYAMEHNLPMDAEYYLKKQLEGPLTKVLEAVMDDPSILFKGDHTGVRDKPTPTSDVGIMAYATKVDRCLGCNGALKKGYLSVCEACKPKEALILSRYMAKERKAEEDFSRLWTQCQSCQGSMSQEVLCGNCDCPIFFARRKAQMNLADITKKLQRFDLSW